MVPCQYCGAPVKRAGAQFCSRRCAGLAKQHYKVCVICGVEFPSPPSSSVKTCSNDCSVELRKRQAYELGHNVRLDAARRQHVEHTPLEDWQTAKYWVLLSPSGQQYECKNLIEFFRRHQDMIDGTPEQAARGIITVKCTMTGSRKRNKCAHWKGWRLLAWDDCGVKPRRTKNAKRAGTLDF